jgi:hypothetical protein
MTQDFCHTCNSEVEDTGGFCLLGHRLRLEAPAVPSVGGLREEVDRAFESVRMEAMESLNAVAAAARPEAGTLPSAPVSVAPAPPAPLAPSPAPTSFTDEVESFLARQTSQPAPPPPPPARAVAAPQAPTHARIYRALDAELGPIESDPIAAFAPPPRMDWGPERGRLAGALSSLRRKATDATA